MREAEARRAHIVRIVKDLIKQGGAQAVTIRKVAELAGFSTTIVYSLYGDKATLITRAMDEDLLALVGAMRAAADHVRDPEQKIRLAGRAYIEFGMSHPDEYALVFMERRPHAPVEAADVEHGNVFEDPYAYAHALFKDWVASGTIVDDTEDGHLLTQVFWQGLHGMTSLALVMGADDAWTPTLPTEKHINTLLDVLLDGIKARFAR